MALIVEDGSGVYNANSYVGLGFARQYLNRRNRLTAWDAASIAEKEAALVSATDYIERRFGDRFSGLKQYYDFEVAAYNILEIVAQPHANDTITLDDDIFTFKVTPISPGDIEIGSSITVTRDNIITAINTVSTVMIAAEAGESAVVVESIYVGVETFLETLSSTSRLIFDYETLVGGTAHALQQLSFPRSYLYDRYGNAILGVPEILKIATVEYATRALSGPLLPDPETTTTGQTLTRERVKIGPIEEEKFYADGSTIVTAVRLFPDVDNLLKELLGSSQGGVYR